ncbi:hypothetical protein ABZX40_30935 [Streptomyces sp. NPDC004610]|uniref:hypothetical protein n=1 Tax=unclassified Streptomyces TaxID=2593676 RepID=UPI0033A7E6DD
MPPFSQLRFDEDKARLLSQVKEYGLHRDREFMDDLHGFLAQVNTNGLWVNQGHAPRPDWAGDQVDRLVAHFDRKHAFHVPARWWKRHKDDPTFRRDRRAKAEEARRHGWLWMKTEPYHPAAAAEAQDGLILEKSVPGKLFDRKDFGGENWSSLPALSSLWEQFAIRFASGLEGEPEAMVLGGIVQNSVLTRLEWPHLRDRIQTGQVDRLRINVMRLTGSPSDSRQWSLELADSYDVRSQGSFDRVGAPTDPDFWAGQERWHHRQRANHAGDSPDRASADSPGGYSLHDFHTLFDDPNVLVTLSDPFTDDPVLTASPEEISRLVSGHLTRTQSHDSAGAGPSSGAADLPADPGREGTAMATLDRKLEAIRAEQERRGSHSTSSAASVPLVRAARSYTPYESAAPPAGQSRTPSTASAGSDDGVPLTRVDRVPSDPPREPPRDSARQSTRQGAAKPPAWMRWVTKGAGPDRGRRGH